MTLRCRTLGTLLWAGLLLFAGCEQPKIAPSPGAASAETKVPHTPKKSAAAEVRRSLFENVASRVQVDFQYRSGEDRNRFAILESMGGGSALLDFDVDGDLDLFLPGGGDYEGNTAVVGRPGRLYRNELKFDRPTAIPGLASENRGPANLASSSNSWNRSLPVTNSSVEPRPVPERDRSEWSFRDVTANAGMAQAAHYSHGCATSDWNQDGFIDLLVTGYGGLVAWQNQGDGTLIDVTATAGLNDRLWSTSAAFGDLNGDQHPDLYVAHYVNWSLENDPFCKGNPPHPRDVCPPRRFEGLPDVVYFSNGDGTFRDGSIDAGLKRDGKGIGVVMADLDLDGDLDLYVANDKVANFQYQNDGRGQFEDVSLLSGTALSDMGTPDGSMGTDIGDYNLDGLPDLWVANYERESFGLYRNLGQGLFRHVSQSMGITAVGGMYVGWGSQFLDFDLDGDEDIFVSNGHVIRFPTESSLSQMPLLFENQDRRRFVNVAQTSPGYLSEPHRGRGVSLGDLDLDGDPDLVLTPVQEPVAVLENDAAPTQHGIGIRPVGTRSPRDGTGCRITVQAGNQKWTRQVRGGSSYASASDRTALFGLAQFSGAESGGTVQVHIRWPSGREQQQSLSVDRTWQVIEPLE